MAKASILMVPPNFKEYSVSHEQMNFNQPDYFFYKNKQTV